MYELLDSETISDHIIRNPMNVEKYAAIMAELAHTIHSIEVTEDDGFPEVAERLRSYISTGVEFEDEKLAERCRELFDTIPVSNTLVHGDFHTNNVFLQNGEPLLIDLDRISRGDPRVEIADFYYFYVVLGENDPSVVEKFMGFSYDTSQKFFHYFLKYYLDTADEDRLRDVIEKISFICYVRMIHNICRRKTLSDAEYKLLGKYMRKISEMADRIDSLTL
jgi:aminoglycoside phosphotransferase (APT) family kinase protein